MRRPRIHGLVLALALASSACGEDDPPSEADDAGGDASTSTGADADAPRFAEVAAILGSQCAGCHKGGGPAPFAMRTHADIAMWAQPIATSIADRTMPPWGVDNGGDCRTYADARWLEDDEIATILAWVDAGAPAGDPSDDMLLAPPDLDTLDASAHVVEMTEPYIADAAVPDDYRCFVLDPQLAEDRWLTAYEVRPGNTAGVHHVLLYGLVDDDADASALALDDAESGTGYTCFGGPGVEGGFRFLAGWAPGTGVTTYPEGTGIRVAAGHRLVMQVHYNNAGGVAPDRSAVAMQLATAIDREAEVLPMADLELALAPGQTSVATATTTTVEDFGEAELLGVYPHMHKLGRQLRVDHDRAGASSCLVDVPRWNFEQQQFYFYDAPFVVRDGDSATITCTYDTSAASAEVTWGEGTADEMCLAGFYLVRG